MENEKTSQIDGKNSLKVISEEEENYVRMSLLLSGISARAVRRTFDRELPPSCLNVSIKKAYKKIEDLNKKKIINQSQLNLLFPSSGVPDSTMFDITLMTTVLTNLTGLKRYTTTPLEADTSPSADLERIKYHRNQVSHNTDGKIDSTIFSKAWTEIIQAVGRLGGKNMLDECEELRTKILEQSTVPWNIRVQISKTLETWKINDSTFVETRATKHVLECAQKNSCVTVIASPGVGKTATLRHVALKMADEGYNVLIVSNTHDIINFFNPNQKTLFVMDDFCGTYSIDESELNSRESDMGRIKELIKNKLTKLIVTCRLQVYQDEKFESLPFFRTCVCNLLSEDLCLSQTEKMSIAKIYLGTKATEIKEYCYLYDCFPLICKLYNDNPELDTIAFFKNPFSIYESEIDKLRKKRINGKYCALALCVMFNNSLKEEWLTDEIDTRKRSMIEHTCEACRMDRGTSRLVLLDELKTLEYSFIKKEQGVFKTIHDKIFDFLSFYFGKNMIQCLIKYGDALVVMQRFLFKKTNDMDKFITVVPTKYHLMYLQRMIDELSIGRVQCVFININMKIPEFRERFLCCLKALDNSLQRQLSQTCDVYNKDTVLFQCCYLGDIPLTHWCIHHGVDVNQFSRSNQLVPLHISAYEGHTGVVKVLLDNNADINKCDHDGQSPLFFACRKNHIETVKVLLDNQADINKCRDDGSSPLMIACYQNHIETVEILLDNKADINKSDNDGASPLYIACQENNLETVKILLDNEADINKSTENGSSPLYIACENNHIETIKVLLDNKADIYKCRDTGSSPLFVACQENHVEIVKVLLDNKADINKCMDNGASPLFVACQKNHIWIVKILLDNNADINKCIDNGLSPLYIACENNHKETLKLLLNNNADINKCRDTGSSPLFVACQENHIEIVNVLLDNKADINKCRDYGVSPLFVACQQNHIETIKVLLDNKANINKCMGNGASPLFVACQNNHIETVKILLDNKADINKSIDNGSSPLYIACEINHIETVKVLLDNKADMHKCRDTGSSPLYVACQNNHIETVKVLLDNKADINKCDNEGKSPLFVACRHNNLETVTILLDNKADINKCKDNGVSPLYIACQENHIEIVKILLDNKADINKCRYTGASPLVVACYNNHKEIIRILLEKGSNYNASTNDGLSPIEIARKMEHRYVINMINEHSKQDMQEEPPNKKNKSDTRQQRRSTRKSHSNDQSDYSSTTPQRTSPRQKHRNRSGISSTIPQRRSPRKKLKNDQICDSSTTPKRRSPRKTQNSCQVVKLVENASFTVNSKELRKIVLKAKGEKNTGSYLVLKLMDLVFSIDEMGHSRCQGLRPAKSGDTRLPLDAEKIKTVKAYSEGFCRKNGRKQATNAEMNRAISQAVAYSRKKLKK